MNNKNFLSLLMIFLLSSTASITAMLSKPQSTQEERKYTQTQLSNQETRNDLLFNECGKNNPDAKNILHLIKLDADVNAQQDIMQMTPLHYACHNEHFNIAKLLIEEGADIEVRNNKMMTPLHFTCQCGNFDIAEFLISKHANVNVKADKMITPLHMVCQYGYLNIAELLIKNGADIKARLISGSTPLHLASEYGRLKIVGLLIKEGANTEATRSDDKATPLHRACAKNHVEVVAFLLKSGAIVNATMINDHTALHFAVIGGYVDICKLLLKAGANINAKTNDAFSSLDLAHSTRNNAILNLLQQYGASIISQKQADENMRAFIAELNEEKLQKGQKNTIRQEKKHTKKNEQTKQAIKSNKQLSQTTPTQITPQTPIEPAKTELFLPQPVKITPINTTLATSTTSTAIPTLTTSITPITNTSSYIASTPKALKTVNITSSSVQSKYDILIDKKVNALLLNDTIKDHIKQLKNWPQHGGLDVKKLAGKSNMYRLRVGGYRIIFSVENANHEIKIHEIDLRKNIYKNLKL